MEKVSYVFNSVKGEKSVGGLTYSNVTVNDECAAAIAEFERQERNYHDRDIYHGTVSLDKPIRCGEDGEEFVGIDVEDKSVDIEGESEVNDLRDFIATMPKNQQQIIALLENGFDIKEIADKLGVGVTAIYNARERIKKQIKKFLSEPV